MLPPLISRQLVEQLLHANGWDGGLVEKRGCDLLDLLTHALVAHLSTEMGKLQPQYQKVEALRFFAAVIVTERGWKRHEVLGDFGVPLGRNRLPKRSPTPGKLRAPPRPGGPGAP